MRIHVVLVGQDGELSELYQEGEAAVQTGGVLHAAFHIVQVGQRLEGLCTLFVGPAGVGDR